MQAVQEIPSYAAADDLTHRDDGDAYWQESFLFVWHDLASGLGGFWRIGQEPVVGAANSCFGIFTGDGHRFRSNVTGAPLAPGDRGEREVGLGPELRLDLERLAILADFPELKASLRFEDFFPRLDTHRIVGRQTPSEHARAHFEVAGRMTGRVLIGGREIEVDALGYRDKSWGPRRWSGIRSTRWWPAVFGPDLCVHSIVAVDAAGKTHAGGYVWRDGAAHPIREIDSLACLEADGITPRSGRLRASLDTGEALTIDHEPADGVVLHVRGYTAVESIGRARWGDRIGMSNFEVATNPSGGAEPPAVVFGADNGQGLSRRP